MCGVDYYEIKILVPNHYNGSKSILQVVFPKKLRNIPIFLRKRGGLLSAYNLLIKKTKLAPGNAAFVRLDIYQNDVGAHLTDTAPWDHIVIPPAPQMQKTAGAGHDDGHYLPLRQLDPHVGDEAQPLSVADGDDLLAEQVREFDRHKNSSRPYYLYIVWAAGAGYVSGN